MPVLLTMEKMHNGEDAIVHLFVTGSICMTGALPHWSTMVVVILLIQRFMHSADITEFSMVTLLSHLNARAEKG